LKPAAIGQIDTVRNIISVSVPANTLLGSLVPTITASRNATLSPASGVARDFSVNVTYRVAAEDPSVAERSYNVVVSLPISVDPLLRLDYTVGNQVRLTGRNFKNPTGIYRIVLIDTRTNVPFTITAVTGTSNTLLFNISNNVPVGTYRVVVNTGAEEVTLNEQLRVVATASSPVIVEVSTLALVLDGTFTITGRNFGTNRAALGVFLMRTDGSQVQLTTQAVSANLVSIQVPASATTGNYPKLRLEVANRGSVAYDASFRVSK
jgi:hypothetical protein